MKFRPSPELEAEIMEYIFSNRCPDHKEALKIWNKNPWIAVSMYEVHQYPENLAYPIAFPAEVEVPAWYEKKLAHEEVYALEGNPLYVAFPRCEATEVSIDGKVFEVNKFGRVLQDLDDEEGGLDF